MIVFSVWRAGRGKSSRRIKKFPRKHIFHRKDAKIVNWYKGNLDDDNYPLFDYKMLTKFLKANIGRPVSKVFAEYLGKCSKSCNRFNLKEEFFGEFLNKEDIRYAGGFYLSNGIINFKSKKKRPIKLKESISNNLINKKVLYSLCLEAERTHKKKRIGQFYVRYDTYEESIEKVTVYVTTNKDYKEWYSHTRLAEIIGYGIGVDFLLSYNPIYTTYDSYKWGNRTIPYYVFITKPESLI